MASQLNVRLPEELMDTLKRRSEETGATQAWIVRKALEEWLAANDPEYREWQMKVMEDRDPLTAKALRDAAEGSTPTGDLRFRCPVHKNELRSSPNARCFCNRKTSEAV